MSNNRYINLLLQPSFFEGVVEFGVEFFTDFLKVCCKVLHGGFFYVGGGYAMSNEQRVKNSEQYGIKKESKRDNLHSIRTLQILISAPNRWFDCCLLSISNKNVSFHFIVNC